MTDSNFGDAVLSADVFDDPQRATAISRIAAAFASRDSATIEEIVDLTVRLSDLMSRNTAQSTSTSAAAIAPTMATVTPALKIEDAVNDDTVYCLCCGRGFTMLKRHLKAEHGLTEEQYRVQFGLPEDFPLVAPSYSERKAAYAREAGLGKYSRAAGSLANARTSG
ncbi:MAG: MucR family transcriptional regulator [Brevirhabdus sp.]